MALMRGLDMERMQMQQQMANQPPPKPTLREKAFKSAKKSTILCIALAIISIPCAFIDRSTPSFFTNLFAF